MSDRYNDRGYSPRQHIAELEESLSTAVQRIENLRAALMEIDEWSSVIDDHKCRMSVVDIAGRALRENSADV